MNIIVGGRGSGKTVKLIELSIKMNAYILVSDHRRAVNVKQMAVKMGYPQMLFPITYREFWNQRNTGYVKRLLIDDADDLLEHMASIQGWNLSAATISKSAERWFELNVPNPVPSEEFKKRIFGGDDK